MLITVDYYQSIVLLDHSSQLDKLLVCSQNKKYHQFSLGFIGLTVFLSSALLHLLPLFFLSCFSVRTLFTSLQTNLLWLLSLPTERLEPLDAGHRSDGRRDGSRPLPQLLQEQLHLGHTHTHTHTHTHSHTLTETESAVRRASLLYLYKV